MLKALGRLDLFLPQDILLPDLDAFETIANMLNLKKDRMLTC